MEGKNKHCIVIIHKCCLLFQRKLFMSTFLNVFLIPALDMRRLTNWRRDRPPWENCTSEEGVIGSVPTCILCILCSANQIIPWLLTWLLRWGIYLQGGLYLPCHAWLSAWFRSCWVCQLATRRVVSARLWYRSDSDAPRRRSSAKSQQWVSEGPDNASSPDKKQGRELHGTGSSLSVWGQFWTWLHDACRWHVISFDVPFANK